MSTREVKITNFEPRWYQRELINALEHEGKRKLVVSWPRRAGKDVVALNIMLRQAFKRVGVYYYLYPKYDQCRRAVWDSILITGEKFLDFIPSDLIQNKNNVEMKITLINGSIIQFNGADNADSLRGTNPVGVIFSEYSRVNHPDAYNGVIAPILAVNDGWVIFISTPNGHNEFYNVFKYAETGGDSTWYSKLLTTDDTKHVSDEILATEKSRMSDELFMQEYYCSFEIANTGSYYAKYLQAAYSENRIGFVPYDSAFQVHTAWDLGWRSPSVIIFFQVIGKEVRVIDVYHKNNEDLAHYVGALRSYPYVYGSHFVPHDAHRHELGSGMTRIQILEQLGLRVVVLEMSRLSDGIEVVRHTFKRIFFDSLKCSMLLDALESYSRKWDSVAKRFLDKDTETWANDFCDAFRYMCLSLSFIESFERSTEEFNRRRLKLMYGIDVKLPSYFESR